jgi:hypothetical protein
MNIGIQWGGQTQTILVTSATWREHGSHSEGSAIPSSHQVCTLWYCGPRVTVSTRPVFTPHNRMLVVIPNSITARYSLQLTKLDPRSSAKRHSLGWLDTLYRLANNKSASQSCRVCWLLERCLPVHVLMGGLVPLSLPGGKHVLGGCLPSLDESGFVSHWRAKHQSLSHRWRSIQVLMHRRTGSLFSA